MESTPYREKTTLPRAAADVSEFDCVTAFATEVTPSVSEFGNINPMPFREIVHSIIINDLLINRGRCNGFLRSLRTD